MTEKIERVTPPVLLGEGPVWDVANQKLYYVDILGQKICRFDPANGKVTSAHLKGGLVGVVVQVEGTPDKLVAGCGRDIVLVTWSGESDSADPPVKTLATVDTDHNDTRINDGKCDPAGRFWLGTMSIEVNGYIKPNQGSFYRCGTDLDPKKILTPISISNGLTWNSKKNVMYYIDSPTRQVVAFDYDDNTGTIKNQKVIFDLEKNNVKGLPDGMTIDTDDNLWIALYDGGAIIKVDPTNGKLLQTVKMPADKITSVAFGGPNFDILYVTSASAGLTDEQLKAKTDSGCVFAIKDLKVRGHPPSKFRMH